MQIGGIWQLLIKSNKIKQNQMAAYHIPIIENERTAIKTGSDNALFVQLSTKRVKTGTHLFISESSLIPQQLDANRPCSFTLNKLFMEVDLFDFSP